MTTVTAHRFNDHRTDSDRWCPFSLVEVTVERFRADDRRCGHDCAASTVEEFEKESGYVACVCCGMDTIDSVKCHDCDACDPQVVAGADGVYTNQDENCPNRENSE